MSLRGVFRDARYVLADLVDGVLSLWEAEAVKRAYGAADALADKEAEEDVAEPCYRMTTEELFTLRQDAWDHRPPICSRHYPDGCGCFPSHLHGIDERPCWCDKPTSDGACTLCPRPSHPGACLDPYSPTVAPSTEGRPLSSPPAHAVDSEGPHDCGGVPAPAADMGATNVVDAIADVLADHYFTPCNHSSVGPEAHCACGARPYGLGQWRKHVAPIIAATVRVSAALTEREERLQRRADRLNGGPY